MLANEVDGRKFFGERVVVGCQTERGERQRSSSNWKGPDFFCELELSLSPFSFNALPPPSLLFTETQSQRATMASLRLPSSSLLARVLSQSPSPSSSSCSISRSLSSSPSLLAGGKNQKQQRECHLTLPYEGVHVRVYADLTSHCSEGEAGCAEEGRTCHSQEERIVLCESFPFPSSPPSSELTCSFFGGIALRSCHYPGDCTRASGLRPHPRLHAREFELSFLPSSLPFPTHLASSLHSRCQENVSLENIGQLQRFPLTTMREIRAWGAPTTQAAGVRPFVLLPSLLSSSSSSRFVADLLSLVGQYLSP